MLFHKKTKKAIKLVWTVIAILIAVSMVMVYSSGY
jgi:tryptophan-rich sensory protein